MYAVQSRFTGEGYPITLLMVGAIACAVIAMGGVFSVNRNTKNLVSAEHWVEHTQEVLLSVEEASRYNDRVESRVALYQAMQNETQLESARLTSVRLKTYAVHLRNLVADNPGQAANVEEFTACSEKMSNLLDKVPVDAPAARAESIRCRQALQLMSDREHQLLLERSETSRKKSRVSELTEFGLAGLCLVFLLVVFVLLLRDVLQRRKMALEATKTNLELAQSLQELQDRAEESALISASRQEMQICQTLEQLYLSAARYFARLLPATMGTLYVINSSRNLLEGVSSWPARDASAEPFEVYPPQSCCGLRLGHLRWRHADRSELDCEHFVDTPAASYLCVPLAASGDSLGVLYIDCPTDEAVQMAEKRTEALQQLAQLTATTLGALQLRIKLENQSIRDPLTGLFNRNFMQIAFDRELTRAARRKSGLAVLMLDIDHFKKFNDQFGHAAGDAVLKAAAETMRSKVRNEDILCRFGGEEFTIILPDISPEVAMQRAELLRQAIAETRVSLEHNISSEITISIGVALYPSNGETAEQLLKEADAALYRAKRAGRNQTVLG
jgi:diguanylate cyclase (GGDEF)-like protein